MYANFPGLSSNPGVTMPFPRSMRWNQLRPATWSRNVSQSAIHNSQSRDGPSRCRVSGPRNRSTSRHGTLGLGCRIQNFGGFDGRDGERDSEWRELVRYRLLHTIHDRTPHPRQGVCPVGG